MADYQVIPDGPNAFAVKVTFPSNHAIAEQLPKPGLKPSEREQ